MASSAARAGKGAEYRMSGYNEIGAMNFAEGFLLAGGQADILRKIIVKEYDLDEVTANWHIEHQVLVDRFCTETRATMRKSAHQETAQPVPCQMINCFCMYSDYTPLTLEEWVECDQRRRNKADR